MHEDPIESPGQRLDDAAIERLLERHMPGLRAHVRTQMGAALSARESSADVVQSVCRELLRARSSFEFRGDAALLTWLYRAASQKILEKARYHRSQKRDVEREAPPEGSGAGGGDRSLLDCHATLSTPSRCVAIREELARVEAAFATLSREERDVVTLTRMAGLSHAEVAEQMNRTPESSRALLHRALVKLSRALGRSGC